jgi:excisionase family DNA binding protein
MAATKIDRVNDLWTIAALADALGVADGTIESYLWRKRIPVTLLGRTRLIKLSDMDGYKVPLGVARKLLESCNH